MFGSCALLRFIALLFAGIFLAAGPRALAASSQRAVIIEDDAQVYQDADFDAPVIAHLRQGMTFDISTKEKGPFYRIRLQPGILGWIADNSVKPLGPSKADIKKESKSEKAKDEKIKDQQENQLEAKKKSELLARDYLIARYRGGELEWINYAEQTMGKQRSSGMFFYGLKFSGVDTAFSGATYADSNLLLHWGAPAYYGQATGESASGFLLLGDVMFETPRHLAPNLLYFYGMGPMARYSRYSLALPNGTSSTSYTAEDAALGLDFNAGLALRWKLWSFRAEAKYYWEKNRYYGVGLAAQYQF